MPQDINHWDDDPQLWSTMTIDGNVAPGIVKVDLSPGVGRKLDAKSAPGGDGGTIKDKGLALAKIKVTLTFWLKQHWSSLQTLVDRLQARRALSDRDAVELWHPTLALAGISKAVIETVGGVKPSSVAGAMEIVFEFIEYNPPPQRSATRTPGAPGKAASEGEGGTATSARDAVDVGGGVGGVAVSASQP